MTIPDTEISFTVYYGTFIHTPILGELQVFTNTAVTVNDSNGKIDSIQQNIKLDDLTTSLTNKEYKIIDISQSKTKFFFPGFIDTHIHAPQFPNNGIFGDSTLLNWLTTYTFPLESSLKDLVKAQKVYEKVIQRTISHGTTCASYYATIDSKPTNLLADLCLAKGQRAFIGKVCMDSNSPDYYCETVKESQDSTLEVLNHINELNSSLIKPILTPRFAPSCSSELLTWLGDLKQEKHLHSQTHIDENIDEIKWVKQLFPNSKSYADVYNDHNLLDDKTILAHAIHLTDHELELIKLRRSGISHCPVSNTAITSGEARIRWLLDNGINVGLGTDISGGYNPSILQTAREALMVSRHLVIKTQNNHEKLSVQDVLYLATIGGAKVLGLQDSIGSFQLGHQWDCQLIDLESQDSPIDVFDWQLPTDSKDANSAWLNLVSKWLFNGDDRNTTNVWVNGKQVK